MRSASEKPRWRYGTPPQRFRKWVPYRVLDWIFNHYFLCWADMVWWHDGYDYKEWAAPSGGCLEPYDYCGAYQHCIEATRERVRHDASV